MLKVRHPIPVRTARLVSGGRASAARIDPDTVQAYVDFDPDSVIAAGRHGDDLPGADLHFRNQIERRILTTSGL